jgi:hypothetical protein
LVGAALAGGYVAGASDAPTAKEARIERRAAFAPGFKAARAQAFESAEERGRTTGHGKGRADGQEIGASDGSAEAETAISEEDRLAAESAPVPSTDPYDYALDTPGSTPSGTSCPPPFTYHIGLCQNHPSGNAGGVPTWVGSGGPNGGMRPREAAVRAPDGVRVARPMVVGRALAVTRPASLDRAPPNVAL